MKNIGILFRISFKLSMLVLLFSVVSCRNRSSYNNSSYNFTTVSYYANHFNGKPTASGETYKHSKMTGAHKSFAFGTKVEIVNVENNKSVIIVVNDRGSLRPSRAFDLSQGAFKKIANLNDGVVKVKYRILK